MVRVLTNLSPLRRGSCPHEPFTKHLIVVRENTNHGGQTITINHGTMAGSHEPLQKEAPHLRGGDEVLTTKANYATYKNKL